MSEQRDPIPIDLALQGDGALKDFWRRVPDAALPGPRKRSQLDMLLEQV